MKLYFSEDGQLRSGWRFAVAAVFAYLADYAAGNAAAVLAGRHQLREMAIYAPLGLTLLLALFLGFSLFLDRTKQNPIAYIGLPHRRWLQQALSGFLLGFAMVTVAVVVMAFRYGLSVSFNLNPHNGRLALVVVFILVTGAMYEEMMFRGYVFQRLVEGIGPAGAILVLSALFGGIHLANPHISDSRAVEILAFVNTLLFGVILALAYLRTRALWFPWGLHLGWNASLGFLYGLPVSGLTAFSVVVRSKVKGPGWVLGGSYGIEAGFLGTVMILFALAYILIFLKSVPNKSRLHLGVDQEADQGIQPTGTF